MPLVETPGSAALPLPDHAITKVEEDQLGFTEIAEAFASILDSPDLDTPTVAALNGPWGIGKTSLVNLIMNRLRSQGTGRHHESLYFDAWQNEVGDAGAVPLLRIASNHLDQSRGAPGSWISILPGRLLPWRRRVIRAIWKAFLGALLSLAVFLFLWNIGVQLPSVSWSPLSNIGNYVSLTLLAVVLYQIYRASFHMLPTLSQYVERKGRIRTHADLSKARNDFESLVEKTIGSGHNRFFIIIDNLDRCRSETSLEILQAIKKILNVRNVVVILPVDNRILEQQLGARLATEYHLDAAQGQAQAHLYLEKIVNLQYDLPFYPPADMVGKLDDILDDGGADKEDDAPPNLRSKLAALYVDPWLYVWFPSKYMWNRRDVPVSPSASKVQDNNGLTLLWLLTTAWMYFPLALARVISWAMLRDKYPFHERAQNAREDARPTTGWASRTFLVLAVVTWIWGILQYAAFALGLAVTLPYAVSLSALFFTLAIVVWLSNVQGAFAEDQEILRSVREEGLRQATARADGQELHPPFDKITDRVTRELILTWFIAGVFRAATRLDRPSAEDEQLVGFLKANPRQVTRFKNRMRIAALLLDKRNALGHGPEVGGAQMTKWTVLEERWSHHARATKENPAVLAAWEKNPPKDFEPEFKAFLQCEPMLADSAPFLSTMSNRPFRGIATTAMSGRPMPLSIEG